MIGIQLEPVDTWFFRDGTPFTLGSSPQENVPSLFPPHPPTTVGALRAALARRNGWDGLTPWPDRIRRVLGDGPDLGMLRFGGPFLLLDGVPLFPMPRHLLGVPAADGWGPTSFLRPGRAVACDLGDDVRLPEPTGYPSTRDMQEAGVGRWLTVAGMNAVLRGACPGKNEVVSSACLWSTEPRIGLARDSATRTAKEGMLYSTRHVRPQHGVSLGMHVGGLPSDWAAPFERLLPFGGEHRLAECQEWHCRLDLQAPLDRIKSVREVALIALSPLDIEGGVHVGRTFDELGGIRVVSACHGRPQRIGGWDSLARRPLPIRSVLGPGSTLFCEIPDRERFADATTVRAGLARVGSRQEWGFGLVALGVWPETREMR